MSMKTILHGGAATLVIAGAIGLGAASAQSYSSYDQPTYHHTYHHHHAMRRIHHARYAGNERYREESRPSYRESAYKSERSGEAMRGESGMRESENVPAAFQVPLTEIGKPTDELKRASVRDVDGNSVGYVRDIVTARNGEIRALKINVGGYWGMGGKDVMVDASEFRYEKARNELTTDLPKKDLDSMPAAKG
jgi:PRC-barrel domain protein